MRTFLLLLCLLGSFGACAQAPSPGLGGLVDAAWQRDPQARRLDGRQAELLALADVAAQWTPGPGTVGLGARSDRMLDDRGRQEWELEYAQPVWLPGQAAARRDEAGVALRAVAAERAALRLSLARSLLDAHRSWLEACAARTMAERRQALARELAADVTRRAHAGELPRFDANLAEAEKLQADAILIEQALAVEEAERRFRLLTGSPPPPSLITASRPVGDEHPELTAAREAAALARSRLALTRQSLRDNPEIGLRYRHERDVYGAPFGDSLALRVSIPLASAPRSAAREAGAIAAVTESAVSLERTRNQLEMDQAQAEARLAAAVRVEASARQRQSLAQDNLNLAHKAWQLGERPLESLLRTRAAAFDAEAALLRAGFAREEALVWRTYLTGAME